MWDFGLVPFELKRHLNMPRQGTRAELGTKLGTESRLKFWSRPKGRVAPSQLEFQSFLVGMIRAVCKHAYSVRWQNCLSAENHPSGMGWDGAGMGLGLEMAFKQTKRGLAKHSVLEVCSSKRPACSGGPPSRVWT